jgi:hypothetical protein
MNDTWACTLKPHDMSKAKQALVKSVSFDKATGGCDKITLLQLTGAHCILVAR